MAAIIVPVGFDNGANYDVNARPGDQPLDYEVVKRVDIVNLPLDAYEVWQSAHVDVQAHAKGEFTRERLAELSDRPGRDTVALIDRLIASELLVEFEVGTTSSTKLLQTHRLFGSGEGMGNSAEHPETYRIGRDGDVLLEVVNEVYTLWSVAYAYPSIWDFVLEDIRNIPPGVPYSSAEELGHLHAAAIPMLVATRTGVLQPV